MKTKPNFLRRLISSKYIRFFYSTRRRKIFFGILFLIIVGYLIRNSQKSDYTLDLYEVTQSSLEEKVTASGEVMAEKAINLAFVQPGSIEEIFVEDGAVVSKDQAIARIDTTKLYQSYLSADAALRSTQATLDRTYDDVQGNDTDESFAQREIRTMSETTKDQAYRSLVIAQHSLSEGTLNAPFAGIVNYLDGISIGTYASAAVPSFSLVDPQTVYFEANVNELDISDIQVNSLAKVYLDAYPEEIFEQQVRTVGFVKTITSSGGTAYKVKVSLPQNLHHKFRLGMSGDVDFILSQSENVITVPISAIVEDGDISYVWKVNGGGKITKHQVETGVSSIDEVEITSGISAGEIIIERPTNDLQEGQKVQAENQSPNSLF